MILLAFLIGLAANFIGYIPPGNINLTVAQLTINRGIKQAMSFIIAFSIVEFFFTYFIMNAADWLSQQVHLGTVIDWIMVALFSTMGTIAWINRKKPAKAKENSRANSIKYGILLGIINPVQIPFWLIIGSYLIAHTWIQTGWFMLIIFSAGSAIGAFLCLFLYARFARLLKERLDLSTQLINTSIAILLYAFAAYNLGKEVYEHVFKR